MVDWAGIAWLAVLLLVNAFFVGAEFAVISAVRRSWQGIIGSRIACHNAIPVSLSVDPIGPAGIHQQRKRQQLEVSSSRHEVNSQISSM